MSVPLRTDDEIHPFRIDIPDEQLDDLAARLDRARWPDEVPGAGWDQGAPLGHVRELARYWRHGFDWRTQEKRLNEAGQFTTTLDGATVHFLHVRSAEPGARPLLLAHGWPGSVVEFRHVLGPLTDPVAHGGDPADAYHVVVPSMPGFGFSGPAGETGWGVPRVARAYVELMRRLGYPRFGAHGGDWGALVSREMGLRFPDRLLGVHLTMLPWAIARGAPEIELTEAERELWDASAERAARFSGSELGYAMIQSTRPQTLAYGLTDSPVGQLAWLADKFGIWADPDRPVDRDDLLTNVMFYWLTGTANSSSRIYRELSGPWGGEVEPSTVPTGVTVFPRDTARPVRPLAERTERIVRWSEPAHGGHFPGLEVPDVLVGELRAFFREQR
jgi:pimeloyl-ACP methyl ester carboxylesterase